MAKNRLKSFIVFAGVAMQMLVIIYGGSYLGKWLDAKYTTSPEPFYETWVTLAAVFLSIAGVIIQVIKFSKQQ